MKGEKCNKVRAGAWQRAARGGIKSAITWESEPCVTLFLIFPYAEAVRRFPSRGSESQSAIYLTLASRLHP